MPYEPIEDVLEDQHYTKIDIVELNRHFKGRTLFKIEQYLSSMYRQDFRHEILRLYWRGKALEFTELDNRLLTNYEGDVYNKRFDFEIEDEGGEKKVYGWVGVLREGSRSLAGFSVLHSDRVIKGYPDSWRPSTLYGQDSGSNDLVNQRLVGEIHLDAFEVSHTKDNIQWYGDQEQKVENGLSEECGEFREIAKSFRRMGTDQRGPTEVETNSAVDAFQKELSSPELSDVIKSDPMLPSELVNEVVQTVKDRIVGEGTQEKFSIAINGLSIRLYLEEDMSPNDPYVTIDSAQASKVIVIVNAAHPHWSQLSGSAGVLNYLRHCVYDGIAEWQARQKIARLDPDTIKILKDKLLRLAFEIERHELPRDSEEVDSAI